MNAEYATTGKKQNSTITNICPKALGFETSMRFVKKAYSGFRRSVILYCRIFKLYKAHITQTENIKSSDVNIPIINVWW
jgi:hypothetical protein